MRGAGWLAGTGVGLLFVASGSGCVSLEEHNRAKAANRNLSAEKETLNTELFDERNVNDNLRTKITSLERELNMQNELLSNLRGETELLEDARKRALSYLEDMQKRQTLTSLSVPKLPGPLDTALKQFAEAHPSEVVYDAAHGTVKWKADLLFPLGSDDVKSTSLDGLRSFAEVLKSAAAADFEAVVVGHTDTRPIQRADTKQKHPTNWHLSTHRAIAVGNVLQRNGYPSDRVGAMGCGEYRPVADNSSEAGQSQNRRVEIYLVPHGSIVAHGETVAMPRATKPPGAKGEKENTGADEKAEKKQP
ncbi:MAG: OmpA family protein [Planctomycetota bacterium]